MRGIDSAGKFAKIYLEKMKMKMFEQMETVHLMEWLRLAQLDLNRHKGNGRKLLEACIVAAAAEMKYRYRYDLNP